MPEQIDSNAGKGGSYEMQPDGSRILLSRTTEQSSAVAPPTDPAAEPLPPLQHPPKPVAEPADEDGDAKPQARIKR